MRSDAELFDRVEEVVHYLWDPIGVASVPEARDEYHSYLGEIYARVKMGDREKLVEYLNWIVVERMGLVANDNRAREVSNVMLAWKNLISKRAP